MGDKKLTSRENLICFLFLCVQNDENTLPKVDKEILLRVYMKYIIDGRSIQHRVLHIQVYQARQTYSSCMLPHLVGQMD